MASEPQNPPRFDIEAAFGELRESVANLQQKVDGLYLAHSREIAVATANQPAIEAEQLAFDAGHDRRRALIEQFVDERCTIGEKHRTLVSRFREVFDPWVKSQDVIVNLDDPRSLAELVSYVGCQIGTSRGFDANSTERHEAFIGISVRPEFRSKFDVPNPGDDKAAIKIMHDKRNR